VQSIETRDGPYHFLPKAPALGEKARRIVLVGLGVILRRNTGKRRATLAAEAGGRDWLTTYLTNAAQAPELSEADELRMGQLLEGGRLASRLDALGLPVARDELELAWSLSGRAQERLRNANRRYVVAVAERYAAKSDVSFEQLVRSGELGLSLAAQYWGPAYARGRRFSVYATWWARQAMTAALGPGFDAPSYRRRAA
jgi:DNA-directed RNA polymerase sigma subunit (sigma70/sigma32)